MIYALTIPENATDLELVLDFTQFLLDTDKGMKTIQKERSDIINSFSQSILSENT